MSDNDDKLVGRLLSRREALIALGTVAAAALIGCTPEGEEAASGAQPATATTGAADAPSAAVTEGVAAAATATVMPTCVARPELTEGPYFVDDRLLRSDIRSDPTSGEVKVGVPLSLTVRVSQVSDTACTVLPGATVDVWHCDALGVYSDVTDPGFDTQGQKWLRGTQVTDNTGAATFTTIYPGWYPGRAVHIHFKIRIDPDDSTGYEFTSQFFFDEGLTDVVHAQEPYASRGIRTLKNEGDGIYQQAGEQMILNLTPSGDGYATTFDVGLQMA